MFEEHHYDTLAKLFYLDPRPILQLNDFFSNDPNFCSSKFLRTAGLSWDAFHSRQSPKFLYTPHCPSCRADIYMHELRKGNIGTEQVSDCFRCGRSFVE